MAKVKIHSSTATHLMAMQELKLLRDTNYKKRIYYQSEITHRLNMVRPVLVGPVFDMLHPQNTKPTEKEQLNFKENRVPIGTYCILFNSAYGKLSDN